MINMVVNFIQIRWKKTNFKKKMRNIKTTEKNYETNLS